MRKSIASFLPLLFTAACNLTTQGEYGAVAFDPEDCGQAFCSLDFVLAAGTSVDIEIDGLDGIDTSRMSLVADDPGVAVVVPIYGFGPVRWRVIGVDEGRTDLVVVDRAGYEVDYTSIGVRRPSSLGLSLQFGPAVAHLGQPEGLEVWTVGAASYVDFHVRPLDWAGGELMGKLELDADMDAALFAALEPSANITGGELTVRPMLPGDYGASFYGPRGLILDVVLEVR